MKTWKHIFVVLSTQLVLLAHAASFTLNIIGNTLNIQSQERIEYQADSSQNLLVIKNLVLGEISFPENFKARQVGKDINLTVPEIYQYVLSTSGKTLWLTPRTAPPVIDDEKAPLFIPIDNANPNQVAALLTKLYTNIKVEVDERQRALLVLVAPQDQSLIRKVITALDQSRPQVTFEAEILEINQDTANLLGIEYSDSLTLNLLESDPTSVFRLGKIGRNPLSFTIKLQALKTSGAARVLAQPRVTTLDGLEARINSTQTTPLVLGSKDGTQTIQNVTTGITMRMTPKVASDGTVEANLVISVSIPTGSTSQGGIQFSSREATTTVRVKNGEPITIGGLLETREITNEQKVPFLGDIPIIGGLFRSTKTNIHHSDLMIVVTPRIIGILGDNL